MNTRQTKIGSLAPVALFVYARPKHTERTVNALLKNYLAKYTDLIVFSDAPKNHEIKNSVKEVRNFFKSKKDFRSVKLIERKHNFGLAKNIIDGVTSTIIKYGRVIVLEDDIETSQTFLEFMNEALNKYDYTKEVWHISGWNYPIVNSDLDNVFFWQIPNCWGWATWRDRWTYFEKDPQKLFKSFDDKKIYKFNLNGAHDFWCQVIGNFEGSISTWAVFWYATIFDRNGYCLNPSISMVRNMGLDGSGENCAVDDDLGGNASTYRIVNWPDEIMISSLAVERITKYYKKKRPNLILRHLSKIKKGIFK